MDIEGAQLPIGRPRVGDSAPRGPSRQFKVRAGDELHERTEALAKREGVPVSTIVRRAIIAYLDKHGA